MKRLAGAIALSFVAIGFAITVGTQPAHADAPSTNSAEGIQISPALVELNGDPGKTYNINLTILNVTPSTLLYTSAIDDFKAKDETGTPEIIVDSTLPQTVSVRSWISLIPQFELATHQSTVVVAHVAIPANAEPGGHYGVIQFSGAPPTLDQTGVGVSASAGVLLLIRVSGDITEKANLATFTTTTPSGSQTSFFEAGPVGFLTRIQNVGNVHVAPTGDIQLHNMFGQLVTTIKVNSDLSNVLPDSIRRFTTSYNQPWMFGRYTADLTLAYGTTGEAITNEISFWVIPYRFILACLFILATVIFVLSRLIRLYNRHIIEKAKNENTTKNKKHSKKKRS